MPQVGTYKLDRNLEVTLNGNGSSPCVLNQHCGSREVLDRIADKWTALIITILARRTHRYGELRREIGGISQKVLTQTLRSLERDGLVEREVFPTVPPRVDYSLTPLGRTLIEPLAAICKWSEAHLQELQQARKQYDQEQRTETKN